VSPLKIKSDGENIAVGKFSVLFMKSEVTELLTAPSASTKNDVERTPASVLILSLASANSAISSLRMIAGLEPAKPKLNDPRRN
jgi:hypothetical protein